ncbi:uncharacterized protein LOC103521868 [Diaphorina citri]|uniref:Uncharacterized protein LOC103521868 n=1 Tax=Diaphorina citri TaxID=121845 RepID=A0A3Q0JIB2_DIACI|nr:uncharacterized protein LOC103521868 [Diaphorina citri]
MVRNYKRKTSWQSWSEESMSQAIIAVRSGEMSLRTAANTHNVPKTTLERKLKKEGDPQTAAHKSLGRFKPVFSDDQEMMLKNYILQMESRLFGLTILDLRSLAYQFAKMNGIQHPFSVQEELAGEDWVEQFLKRQADISLRTPEPTSAARAAAFNRESVKKFFGLLEELVDKYEFPPSRVYNCDETGISTVPNKRSKILSLKGKKQVGSLSSAERGTLITAEICFSLACWRNLSISMNFLPVECTTAMRLVSAPYRTRDRRFSHSKEISKLGRYRRQNVEHSSQPKSVLMQLGNTSHPY